MRYLLTLFLLAIGLQAAPFSPTTVSSWNTNLLNGLVAYWTLDEASGTRYDSWTNGCHLTDVNTLASGSGILNASASLTPGFRRANTTNATLVTVFTNNSATYSFWYKYTRTTTASGAVLHSENTATSPYLFFVAGRSATNVLEVFSSGSSYTPIYTNPSPSEYAFVSSAKTGSNIIVSVNGGSTYSISKTFSTGNRAGFTIGSLAATIDGQGVLVDEVFVHNRILTDAERVQLYNIGKARRFPFNSGP